MNKKQPSPATPELSEALDHANKKLKELKKQVVDEADKLVRLERKIQEEMSPTKHKKPEEKIRISLEVHNTTVNMTVLQMPKCIRGTLDNYSTKHKLRLVSRAYPALTGSTVYLWGVHKQDDAQTVHRNHQTRSEALDYANRVDALIAEWNEANVLQGYITVPVDWKVEVWDGNVTLPPGWTAEVY